MSPGDWFSVYNWEKNPFTFETAPELFVGYSRETRALQEALDSGQKYIVVTGPTGAGKTTLCKHMALQQNTLYLPKPPTTEEHIVEALEPLYRKGLLSRIFRERPTLYNLHEAITKKNRGRIVLIVDEAHETKVSVLEWLRTITDQVPGMTLVLAGLPVLKTDHLSHLETLAQRVTLYVELHALSREETLELVKKRIESVGGKSIEPFTIQAVETIHHYTGGFPRETIRLAHHVLSKAAEKGVTIIDHTLIQELFGEEKEDDKSPVELLEQLPEKQRNILEIIAQKGELTPSQIVNLIDTTEYQTRVHALRSVNNILRRLMNEGLVERKKSGKGYKYYLSPKSRTVFVKA